MTIDSIPENTPYDKGLLHWRKFGKLTDYVQGGALALILLGTGIEVRSCTPGDTTAATNTIEQTSVGTKNVLQSKISDQSPEESE